MILNTKYFGEIEVLEQEILQFPEGIPAFESYRQFAILLNPEENMPFHWLQSLDDGELTFVIVNPFLIKPNYDFKIPTNTVEKLEIEKPEDVGVYVIVNVPEEIEKMTANFKAPIIINTKNKNARQIVLEEEQYFTKHYIVEELKALNSVNAEKEEGEQQEQPQEVGA